MYLVETWLSDDVLDSEVAIHNYYSLIRLDRNRHGGGVAIYVHNCVLYSIVLSGAAELELIIVSRCKPGFKLCLGVFYRPPSSHSSIFDNLCETLLSVDQTHFSNFVLLGDFNANFCETPPLYSHICNLMTSYSLT